MDEAELTRKAVEEIMREMQMQKEADVLSRIQERKINPLGKPNKDFLDRTINSVMNHNKRQHDRNFKNCQRKLRDMDANSRDRKKRRFSSHNTLSGTGSESSSDAEKKYHKNKKNKKLTMKKKKKHKKQSSSSSSTSSSSSSSSPSTLSSATSSESIDSNEELGKKKKRKKHKKKHHKKEEEEEQIDADQYYQEGTMDHPDPRLGLYMDPNMALAAAMAYNQMSHLLQVNARDPELDILKDELESDPEKQDIPSDLSLTYHSSESEDLNISLNSSSAEEDENGILTFNLSSDEEKKQKLKSSKKQTKESGTNQESITYVLDNESDKEDLESVHSYISLKSDVSDRENKITNNIVSILSSSSSDSDCQEVELSEQSVPNEAVETTRGLENSVPSINLEDNNTSPPHDVMEVSRIVPEDTENLEANENDENGTQTKENEEIPEKKEIPDEIEENVLENKEGSKVEGNKESSQENANKETSDEAQENVLENKKSGEIEVNKEGSMESMNIESTLESVEDNSTTAMLKIDSIEKVDENLLSKEIKTATNVPENTNIDPSATKDEISIEKPNQFEDSNGNMDNNKEQEDKVENHGKTECEEVTSKDENLIEKPTKVDSNEAIEESLDRNNSSPTQHPTTNKESENKTILCDKTRNSSMEDDAEHESHNQNTEPAPETVVDLTSD